MRKQESNKEVAKLGDRSRWDRRVLQQQGVIRFWAYSQDKAKRIGW